MESEGATYTGLVVPLVRARVAVFVAFYAAFIAGAGAIVLDDPQARVIALGVMLTLFALTASLSMTRRAMRLVLTDDELVQIGAGGNVALRWDDVVGTRRARLQRTPVLEVESTQSPRWAGRSVRAVDRMTGGRHRFAIPLWALDGSDRTRLERLILRCAGDPEERRRVASGGPGSPGGWPAASA